MGQTSLEQGFAINLMTYDLKVIGVTFHVRLMLLRKGLILIILVRNHTGIVY